MEVLYTGSLILYPIKSTNIISETKAIKIFNYLYIIFSQSYSVFKNIISLLKPTKSVQFQRPSNVWVLKLAKEVLIINVLKDIGAIGSNPSLSA